MSSSTSSSTHSTTAASTPLTSATNLVLKYNQIEPTPANIDKFASVIASAFHSTPLTTIFVAEIDADPSTGALANPPFDHSRRKVHFFPGINSAAQSGADAIEAGDWSAVALWEAPGFQGKPFVEAREKPGKIFHQWRTALRRMKAEFLALPGSKSGEEESSDPSSVQLRPFYHLSFLARNPEVQAVPGAISAVVMPFLERARAEGVPAWLEATYPHAVAIYEHFGFRVCEEVVIGQGKCDGNGWPCQGAEATGLKAWGMIYDEHLR